MLTPDVSKVIASCIDEAGGQEICGFLLSRPDGTQKFQRVTNLTNIPHTFLVSRLDLDRVRRDAARQACRITAFIHSHPRLLALSAADSMAFRAGNLPWIVAVKSGSNLEFAIYQHDKEKS